MVGDYPQASFLKTRDGFEDDGGHHHDRFPKPKRTPVRLRLRPEVKWTGVLSASGTHGCLVVDDEALKVFRRFRLGVSQVVPATVQGPRREKRAYHCLFIANHLGHDEVNFAESKFKFVDMLRDLIAPIKITSATDYEAKVTLARKGELPKAEAFSRIIFTRFAVRRAALPDADLFGAARFLRGLLVSDALKNALEASGVSGIDLTPNRVLDVV